MPTPGGSAARGCMCTCTRTARTRVPQDDPGDAHVCQHLRRHLAREGAALGHPAVLRSHLEGCLDAALHAVQVHKRRRHHDLHRGRHAACGEHEQRGEGGRAEQSDAWCNRQAGESTGIRPSSCSLTHPHSAPPLASAPTAACHCTSSSAGRTGSGRGGRAAALARAGAGGLGAPNYTAHPAQLTHYLSPWATLGPPGPAMRNLCAPVPIGADHPGFGPAHPADKEAAISTGHNCAAQPTAAGGAPGMGCDPLREQAGAAGVTHGASCECYGCTEGTDKR